MNILSLPWIEISIVVPILGALYVSRLRDPIDSHRWCLIFSGATLASTLLLWLSFSNSQAMPLNSIWRYAPRIYGRPAFSIDGLSAPLIPIVALLHFLTVLATSRTRMRQFSFAWILVAEAVCLATYSCKEPWLLVVLLALGTIPAFAELVNRGKPLRVYLLHMLLFIGLLILGWWLVAPDGDGNGLPGWRTIPLVAAILLRSGTIPAHCWLPDLFEHSSFGGSLLFIAPLTGVYAAVRLVLPIAPDWVLTWIGLISLATAVYAAGMAVVQRESRRFFAYLFLSDTSLVLVGLELHTSISLTGSLCLWLSVILSLGGFGLTIRALEARFDRLSLTDYHGLYEQSPTLAVCFMLTGLASVGFPGTFGFIAAELLVDGAVEANLYVGLAVVLAGAINGIAVVRAYFLIFTGTRHVSTISLAIRPRERFAVLTLAALILLGGLYPQPSISTRHDAAEVILEERARAAASQPSGRPLEESKPRPSATQTTSPLQ